MYHHTNSPWGSDPSMPPHDSRPRNPFLEAEQNASQPTIPSQTVSRPDLILPNSPEPSSSDLLIPPSPSRRPSRRPFSSNSLLSRYTAAGQGSPYTHIRLSSRPSSHTSSHTGSDSGTLNTQTVAEKFDILPSDELLLFPDEEEKDDNLHNPDHDDDAPGCHPLSKRGVLNIGGLFLITIGILAIFIGYPVLTFIQKQTTKPIDPCKNNPMCIPHSKTFPNMRSTRLSLVDPDTPAYARTRRSSKGKTQRLVFSDEFNRDGRTFYEGDDPFWQAVDIWYGVTHDLEWYDPDAVTTANGTLNIRFDKFANHGLNYRSGMLQSWNRMCFKGGHLEASISLPGRGDTIGFWPGFWAMGNLGRPGYAASTDGLWPYTYHDECDVGITPNQSQSDGTSYLPGMRLPACTCKGEDHPNPGRSRGAPEIDALEASVVFLKPNHGEGVGSVSQSLQVAPFDIFWQPDFNFVEMYDRSVSEMNTYQGGPFQQAISGLTNLNNKWYNGREYQRYAFEYSPDKDGYVTWYVGPKQTWTLDPRAIGPNGNIGQRMIPAEPLSLIFNFGMSPGFAELNLTGLATLMPATMRVDYVRIYQDEGSELITCDPPGYPTTDYIARHPEAYQNPNLTEWHHTSYNWPQNSFMHDCK